MLIKNTNQRKINPVLEILEDRNAPGAMLQLNTLLPLDLLGKVTLMALNPMAGNHKQRNTLGSDNNLAMLAVANRSTLALSPEQNSDRYQNQKISQALTFLDILDLFPSIPTPPSLVLQNIKSLDRLPFALDDQYQAISGKSLSVSTWNSVLSNDRSSAIHREVHVIDKPVNGALALHSDGSFVYKSVLGYQGLDFFTYQIFDGKNYSNIATVGIDVKSNIPPIKIIAQNQSYVIKANQVLTVDAPGLMKGAIAPPGTVLSAGLDSIPTWGSVTFFPGDGSFVYYPSPDFVGIDSFRYDISAEDPNNGTITSTGLVTIHVKS